MAIEWLNTSEDTPPLDTPILGRTADRFGYGHIYQDYEFDGEMLNTHETKEMLLRDGMVQWGLIEEVK